jgi:glycine/D-amino acid oxidase-like deaminating enzyme
MSTAGKRSPRVAVIGAGAFGGWTALHLLRRGAEVTLVDAWGAGNSRASSGGETRVLRSIYGGSRRYISWTARSLALWKESESAWGERLFFPTGALWMFLGEDDYARSSLTAAQESGFNVEEIGLAAARQRYPQIDFADVRTVFFEKEAGYLLARQACDAVRHAFVGEGGAYRQGAVAPIPKGRAAGDPLPLAGGGTLAADVYVLACGPWLGQLLPELLGPLIAATRQEVFYFGTPAGDARFDEETMPVWVTMGEAFLYGIPGNQRRGFKFADDTRGAPFDPTHGERAPSPDGIARARESLAARFPPLAKAPLLEARVCQYVNTPDGHFILDLHPLWEDLWIAGGGSGHGFKMGPAVGEHVADLVLGAAPPEAAFSLARFGPNP